MSDNFFGPNFFGLNRVSTDEFAANALMDMSNGRHADAVVYGPQPRRGRAHFLDSEPPEEDTPEEAAKKFVNNLLTTVDMMRTQLDIARAKSKFKKMASGQGDLSVTDFLELQARSLDQIYKRVLGLDGSHGMKWVTQMSQEVKRFLVNLEAIKDEPARTWSDTPIQPHTDQIESAVNFIAKECTVDVAPEVGHVAILRREINDDEWRIKLDYNDHLLTEFREYLNKFIVALRRIELVRRRLPGGAKFSGALVAVEIALTAIELHEKSSIDHLNKKLKTAATKIIKLAGDIGLDPQNKFGLMVDGPLTAPVPAVHHEIVVRESFGHSAAITNRKATIYHLI